VSRAQRGTCAQKTRMNALLVLRCRPGTVQAHYAGTAPDQRRTTSL